MPDGLHPAIPPALPVSRAALTARLSAWMAARVAVERATLLPGGAVQHNWRLDLDVNGVPRTLVLRAGPEIPLPESRAKAVEFDLLSRAWNAAVPVAQPLWCGSGDAGRDFLVSAFVPGDADREGLWARADNGALLADLGAALAAIHALAPRTGDRAETPRDRIETLLGWADDLNGVPRGVRTGLDWLTANAPGSEKRSLVHRDYRTGNFLVAGGRLAAVLDWEFAGWGDPAEDIGWFCARCWRGENAGREAGGLGSRGDFNDSYRRAGGTPVDGARVRFWEIFAHVRWALIAMQQRARARAGAWPAHELEEAASRVPALAEEIARFTA